ncbi:universal stress protein [Microvirga sp. 2TAF3]|uniref:universal stress protein n=1 Tax=Microvirga sp. 2TAF3 TaxID=3233014 RepID=UPI003F9A08A4
MPIKDILVHLDTSETGASVTDFALSLASRTNAHLTAVGVAMQYFPTSAFDVYSYETFAQIAEESRLAAKRAFENLSAAAPAGVQVELVMIETFSEAARDQFGGLARHFDFSIVSQGEGGMYNEDRLMIEGALFSSGTPVFVVPSIHKGPVHLGKALIFWDGGVSATRSVAGARDLLRNTAEVEVVSISDEGEDPDELPGFNLTRHLERHHITATLKKLPPTDDIGNVILSYAAESGADFIVMGGYGHWKLRELILGGTTRTVLASMTVPIFMAH